MDLMESGRLHELEMLGLAESNEDDDISDVIYNIPLGKVTHNALLAQLGPLVPVKFTTIGDVDVELSEEVQHIFGTNHIVIINWSKKAMDKVEQLITLNNNQHIVIIDTLNQTPINHPQVHYIIGKPSDTNVLLKANILKAAMVYISAPDFVKDDMLIVGKTVLIASAIQSLANKFISKIPYMIAEINSKKHNERYYKKFDY